MSKKCFLCQRPFDLNLKNSKEHLVPDRLMKKFSIQAFEKAYSWWPFWLLTWESRQHITRKWICANCNNDYLTNNIEDPFKSLMEEIDFDINQLNFTQHNMNVITLWAYKTLTFIYSWATNSPNKFSIQDFQRIKNWVDSWIWVDDIEIFIFWVNSYKLDFWYNAKWFTIITDNLLNRMMLNLWVDKSEDCYIYMGNIKDFVLQVWDLWIRILTYPDNRLRLSKYIKNEICIYPNISKCRKIQFNDLTKQLF